MRLLGVIASAQAGRTTGTGVVCRRGSRPTLSLPDPGRVGGSRRGVGGGREVLPEEIPHGVPDPEVIFKTQGREEGGVGTRPPTGLPSPLGPGFGGQLISVILVIQQKCFGDLHQKYRKSLPRGHTRRPTLPIGGADPPIHHSPHQVTKLQKKKPGRNIGGRSEAWSPANVISCLSPGWFGATAAVPAQLVRAERQREKWSRGPARCLKPKRGSGSVRNHSRRFSASSQPPLGVGGSCKGRGLGRGGGGARQYPLRVARRDEVVPESMVASPSTAQG